MNLYQTAIAQFQRAADIIQLPPDYRSILAEPENEIIVNFPVRLDEVQSRARELIWEAHDSVLYQR